MKYLTLLLLLPIFLSCAQSNNDVEIPSNEIIDKTVLISGLPFIVDITSNGNTNSIILLRISHYNEHDKSFMNEIETIFDNWDLIMSHITTNKQH